MIRNDFYIDVTNLSDLDLDSHIQKLQDERVKLLSGTKPHSAKSLASANPLLEASEIAILLLISTTEKNSRSAREQTQASIALSQETKELAEASHDLSKESARLSKWAVIVAAIGVVATIVNVIIIIVETLS